MNPTSLDADPLHEPVAVLFWTDCNGHNAVHGGRHALTVDRARAEADFRARLLQYCGSNALARCAIEAGRMVWVRFEAG